MLHEGAEPGRERTDARPGAAPPPAAAQAGTVDRLTVGELAGMEQFDCRVLAGAAGLGRPVVWAHSCELEDPWKWLGADELLMTVGICVPRGARAQRRMITELHAAELAGIAIGDDLKAPPLTRTMLDAADDLGFPVLLVGHTTPFAAIGRTVAMAGQSEQVRRLVRVSRLYEPARTAAFGEGSLLGRLSAELGHRLHVLDVALGSEVLRQERPLDADVVARLAEETSGRLGRLPARLCVEGPDGVRATALALSTHRPCMLVADGPGELDADGFLLLHVQSLVSVEVERVGRERAVRDDSGAELLERLVDGELGDEAGNLALDGHGLVGPRTALGVPAESRSAAAALLGDAEVPALVGRERGEACVLLVAASRADEVVALLRGRVPAIGVSASGSAVGQLADTARQARWALQAAVASGGGVADYGTAAPILLPRTVADAEHATRAVLGPVLDHDREHGTDLLRTLETFLATDRSWRDASGPCASTGRPWATGCAGSRRSPGAACAAPAMWPCCGWPCSHGGSPSSENGPRSGSRRLPGPGGRRAERTGVPGTGVPGGRCGAGVVPGYEPRAEVASADACPAGPAGHTLKAVSRPGRRPEARSAMFTRLFTPLDIGPVTIRNRIVSTGHDTVMAHDGKVTDRLVAYHRARARGGVGLVVLQVGGVHDSARYTSHALMADTDACVEGYGRLADAVHEHGATVFAQLFHGGAEVMDTEDGALGVSYSASAVPSERFRVFPRAMPRTMVHEVIGGFAAATARLRRAGLDGVEIVASHGYLPAQFLNPATNRRTDEYGGSWTNRLRFLREVLEAARAAAGGTLAVGLRISIGEAHDRGLSEDAALRAVTELDGAGLLDYVSVTHGSSATLAGSDHIVPPMTMGPLCTAALSRRVKQAVSAPVIVAGRITQPQDAELLLERGDADAAGMTRALICDPELPDRARRGDLSGIRACIGCNQACIGHFHGGHPISCIQRPETGREEVYGLLTPARRARDVLVAGAGPAGLKAAVVAARRGHRVTVYDAGRRPGGQVLLAERLPGRAEFGGAVTNLLEEARRAEVRIESGVTVDAALVRRHAPDAVVVATGARPYRPALETEEATVRDAWQVIGGARLPRGGSSSRTGAATGPASGWPSCSPSAGTASRWPPPATRRARPSSSTPATNSCGSS